MTAKYTITIPNLADIKRVFDEAPEKTIRQIDTAVRKSILRIESAAKREAPVNKQSGGGNLRQSIRSQMTGIASGKVEVGVDYGVYVEEGTRPHIITVKNAKVLANKYTGQMFGRTVKHPGTKANPFFQRGIDAAESDIIDYFSKAVVNVFK